MIKNFIYSIQGKIILFVVDIFAVILALLCLCGAVFMNEFGFYDGTKEDAIKQSIESEIQLEVHDTILRQIRGESGEKSNDLEQSSGNFSLDSSTDTGLRYAIYDSTGKILTQNEKLDLVKEDKRWEYHLYYYKFQYDEFGDKMSGYEFGTKELIGAQIENGSIKEKDVYEVCAYLENQSTMKNTYYWIPKMTNSLYGMRYAVFFVGVLAALAAVVSFIALMYSSGRRVGSEEIVTTVIYRIPWDFLALSVWIICLAIILAGEFTIVLLLGTGDSVRGFDIFNHLPAAKMTAVWMVIYAIVIGSVCLGFCMSTATRIKKKTLWKNTVIYRILRWIKRWKIWGKLSRMGRRGVHLAVHSIEYIPLVGKTILILAVISLIEFFAIAIMVAGYNAEAYLLFWVIEKMILIPVVLYVAWTLKKLQKAGERLAAGDMDYKVDTEKLFWEFKQHGEDLNHIAEGMNRAVFEKMKSERLKTELITNVSHDIKTPLTSIINYADLIGKEKCENPKIMEYSEVLLRQSERLKRLIEDLVEASKASTGNLDVELAPCEAQIFLSQVFGEYEEKLREKNLELVISQPEKSLFVMADGRRMLRIFDNLMTNICKYAQAGTRVYISLEEREKDVVIVLKNISHAALNMSEDELMERFTRGDASRNTEGNGLGLSIARSLAELQNGKLKLEIDGDLFKVMLWFPKIGD